MVAKLDNALVDHAVRLYVTGKTIPEISTELGIGASTLSRKLKARGIKARGRRTELPADEIVEKYRAGASELALSCEYGVSRNVVRRHLVESEVEIRGLSQAQGARYTATTRAERQQITAAANAAMRGREAPEDQLVKGAATREARPKVMSRHEQLLDGWLRERNVPYTREKAVGRYNLDFAVGSVAMEVLGGEWHNTKVKSAIHGRRTPYILDQGWLILFTWATSSHPMTPAVAEYVVTLADELRRNPSLRGEYRVIRGDGELLARGRREDYERTGIVPARYR